MKGLILTSLMFVFAMSASFAQNKMDVLPQTSQDLIKEHFPNETVRKAKKDKDLINIGRDDDMYEVALANGIKMDFNQKGELTDIDSRNDMKIPEGVLPRNVVDYVKKNYNGLHIISWEIDRNDQEVELSDGTDLEFDTEGNFLRVD